MAAGAGHDRINVGDRLGDQAGQLDEPALQAGGGEELQCDGLGRRRVPEGVPGATGNEDHCIRPSFNRQFIDLRAEPAGDNEDESVLFRVRVHRTG